MGTHGPNQLELYRVIQKALVSVSPPTTYQTLEQTGLRLQPRRGQAYTTRQPTHRADTRGRQPAVRRGPKVT